MHYRNARLLRAAQDQPCVLCGAEGTTVAAHANSVALGKGMGIKAPDFYTAWVCRDHHDLIDGRTGGLTKDEKAALWTEAYLKTVSTWFMQGVVIVATNNRLQKKK